MAKKRNRTRVVVGGLGVALGVYLLYSLFRNTDFASMMVILSGISGAGLFILILPSLSSVLLDSLGWRFLLPEEVTGRSFWRMVRVRTASEAVVSTVPLGAVVAEPLKAWLLKRQFSISIACGTASVALRTFVLADAQALIVLIVTVLAFSWLAGFSTALLHNSALSWLALVISLATFGVYTFFILASCTGGLTQKLHGLLTRIPFAKIRNWMEEQEVHFHELNAELSSFGRERAKTVWGVVALYVVVWSLEGIETYIILRLIGSPIALWKAYALEAICSFIRSIAFVIPSGLGVQDAGYVGFLTGSGESHAAAAAFVLIKRLRQLVWIAIGFALLFVFGPKARHKVEALIEGEG